MLLRVSWKVFVAALGTIAGCGFVASHWLDAAGLPDEAREGHLAIEPAGVFAASPETRFLVVAGGGAPAYNEIALEKNVHYFQRTLTQLGIDPAAASVYFANGDDRQATVRYLDFLGREQFKVPEVPHLLGAATWDNVMGWFEDLRSQACPTFFYFTGHGALNRENPDNNAMILWGEDFLSVQELAQKLDTLPADQPFVTMMAQCYAGSFANLIYENGDSDRPVALQTRCGFFATVKTRPSVGCTPLVNESDYEDYSSSFFAGLSGRDRIGDPVPSADYDQNGQVSFAEAHAFSKVDAVTPDLPISTSEAWLQRQASEALVQQAISRPLADSLQTARPEQRFVVESLAQELGFALSQSFSQNQLGQRISGSDDIRQAYAERLRMELVNVAVEAQIRQVEVDVTATNRLLGDVTTLDKLLTCEAGTWK
ncbi:Caspase domain-containing protein [Pseudanabaena sp. FACHB-2040]|uniref:Caspase domain-containing protein n=1 Tax=Pseudanabaena sp. FACHB-2040 TaxID=2692859 RepID=UPI00168498DC|nr:Caspase domain-containing protein [Pseudanabaena sp. FACHB-2040]MBD2257798.1 Caspase domain-containing protein [Pseudanabaena sp. FACHB-2040]